MQIASREKRANTNWDMANYDGVGSANSNSNDVTVSGVVENNVDVVEKSAVKQGCRRDCFTSLSYCDNDIYIGNGQDEFYGETGHNSALNNRIENNNEAFRGKIYNNHQSRPFIDIGSRKVLIFIANALLIHCITSVEPLDNLNHYTDYPNFFNLMKQHIRQFRYNGNNNGNWTDESESKMVPIFNQYVAGGEKVTRLKNHINNILVPRVSGTQGNLDVRNYIVQQLNQLGYNVYLDQFRDRTPLGEVAFGNVIAESNPKACKQLVLACHYDSKKLDGFLGATDSAVPCAILLEIARTIKDHNLVNPSNSLLTHGVRFIFFDGEEAFVEWTDTDSLYGSRHLADKWSKQAMPRECGVGNELKRISLFVLLDLIGARDTRIPRYFETESYYKLMTLERQYLTEYRESKRDVIFNGYYDVINRGAQDDHVPFLRRHVPILLLLSHPFPSVWHTADDNHECIDYKKTVRTLAVMDKFTIDYLNHGK